MAKVNLKFPGVDLLDAMGSIVEAHTTFYKSDFYADDVKKLRDAASNQERDDKCFLWLCRTHGTWLLNERNVFIRNTFEYNTFTFYAANHTDDVLAFAVEVTGTDGEKVIGNLYSLDYLCHASHVFSGALMPSVLVLNYERGTRYTRGDAHITAYPDAEYGALVSYAYLPDSQEDWDCLLRLGRKNRERFLMGNFCPYLATL